MQATLERPAASHSPADQPPDQAIPTPHEIRSALAGLGSSPISVASRLESLSITGKPGASESCLVQVFLAGKFPNVRFSVGAPHAPMSRSLISVSLGNLGFGIRAPWGGFLGSLLVSTLASTRTWRPSSHQAPPNL